jgi:hypothetical protein
MSPANPTAADPAAPNEHSARSPLDFQNAGCPTCCARGFRKATFRALRFLNVAFLNSQDGRRHTSVALFHSG